MRRFFIACTPRTGNVWFRGMFTDALQIPNYGSWTPGQTAWDELPDSCSVSMHWRRSRELEGYLRERDFRMLVTARHPLDVLLSILNLAPKDPSTARWLDGECGDERSLIGATPWSDAFARYALSWRAAALLDVSVGWSDRAAAIVQYAELVHDPCAELERVLRALNLTPVVDVATVVARHTRASLAAVAPHHIWQGTPDLWKRLIVPELATAIADRHPEAFERFGFTAYGDPTLTPARAAQNWHALTAKE